MSEIQEHLLTHSSDYFKLLSLKNIPQCSGDVVQFNADLWEGMTQRLRQMMITNSSEHRINWSLKLENPSTFERQSLVKSIGNMLFLRGDQVFKQAKMAESVFGYQGGVKKMYTIQN